MNKHPMPNLYDWDIKELQELLREVKTQLNIKTLQRDEKQIQELLAFAELCDTKQIKDMELMFNYMSHDQVYVTLTLGQLMEKYDDKESIYKNVQRAILDNDLQYERDYDSEDESDFCLDIHHLDLKPIPEDLHKNWHKYPHGVSWKIL